ncbi:MAG: tRNA(adenine34) deaminase [Gammaproteobacteria bacterium]|jgi:tRNA(adenine34) deaminase
MQDQKTDQHWMRHCIELAQAATVCNEVPVAACLIYEDRLIASGVNRNISDNDPTAHAEIVTLRAAGKAVGNYRLINSTLYVTLEPCVMCAGAIVHGRVSRVVYGAVDPHAGAAGSVANILQTPFLNHQCKVESGVLAAECSQLLNEFFKRSRKC